MLPPLKHIISVEPPPLRRPFPSAGFGQRARGGVGEYPAGAGQRLLAVLSCELLLVGLHSEMGESILEKGQWGLFAPGAHAIKMDSLGRKKRKEHVLFS